jgi:hypothetical protein
MFGFLLSSYRAVLGAPINGQTREPRDSMCDVGAFEVQP